MKLAPSNGIIIKNNKYAMARNWSNRNPNMHINVLVHMTEISSVSWNRLQKLEPVANMLTKTSFCHQ